MRALDGPAVRAAVAGGAVLAGGGGGWAGDGLELGDLAVRLGTPRLATLDEIPADGLVVTVSMVGAPAAPGRHLRPLDYVRAVELLVRDLPGRLAGFISSENGALSSTNGWLQAAMFGVPVIDAPCNGRAHPTGKMGALGLAGDPTVQTVQAAVGGDPARGTRIELVTRGSIARTASLVRQASIQAGGLVAVARNPFAPAVLRERAAVGGLSYALRLGEAMLAAEAHGAAALIDAILATTRGRVLGRGAVRALTRASESGFDVGSAGIGGGDPGLTLRFCNEYLLAEAAGRRLATFPDLITTLAADSGQPISVAELADGQDVVVIAVDRDLVPLGAGVWDPTVYPEIEAVMGLSFARDALARPGGGSTGRQLRTEGGSAP